MTIPDNTSINERFWQRIGINTKFMGFVQRLIADHIIYIGLELLNPYEITGSE